MTADTYGGIESPKNAAVLTVVSRRLPGLRAAKTPIDRPMVTPTIVAIAAETDRVRQRVLEVRPDFAAALDRAWPSPVTNWPSHLK